MTDLGLILLLALHLLAMNVASAGPLLCLPLVRRSRLSAGTPDDLQIAQRLALHSCSALAIGIVLGFAAGGLRIATGDVSFAQAIPPFGRKVMWGLVEIGCSFGWLFGYWYWLKRSVPTSPLLRFLQASLPILAATNLLYHFPPLLTVMSQAASGELAVVGSVTSSEFRALIFTPNVLAHAVHFLWASFAVSGMWLCLMARRSPTSEAQLRLGARVALGATVLQIPTGLWLVMVTPVAQQARLMGSHPVATVCFLSSVVATFLLLQQLGNLALGTPTVRRAQGASALMVGIVALMTGTLHFLRM